MPDAKGQDVAHWEWESEIDQIVICFYDLIPEALSTITERKS